MSEKIETVEVQERNQTTMTLTSVKAQINLIQQIMKNEMTDGMHYGTIPGCGDKPALLKAGAEKLNLTFRMAPKFEITITPLDGGHREYTIRTSLYHIDTGKFLGEGLGSCCTMETKYRYRSGVGENTERPVPKEYWDIRKASPVKAKEMAGDFAPKKTDAGWFWFTKVEKMENPDIADTYNTVLKMAKKRSHVDATLSATAASDIFTQDIEENAEPVVQEAVKKPEPVKVENKTDAVLTPGQLTTLKTKLKEMMAEDEEVLRFIKDKFKKSNITELTLSEASTVLKTWKDGGEPPPEPESK